MATITREDLSDLILQNLGILPAGQQATADDRNLVVQAIESVHDRLAEEGNAPFSLDTIPMWAQLPLRDIASSELISVYGVGAERAQLLLLSATNARKELSKQASGKAQAVPVRPHWF